MSRAVYEFKVVKKNALRIRSKLKAQLSFPIKTTGIMRNNLNHADYLQEPNVR